MFTHYSGTRLAGRRPGAAPRLPTEFRRMRLAQPAALALLVGVVASVGDAEHDTNLAGGDPYAAANTPVGLGDFDAAYEALDGFVRSTNALKHSSTTGVHGWDSFVTYSEFAATQTGLRAFRQRYPPRQVDDAKMRTQHEALVAKRATTAALEKKRRESKLMRLIQNGNCSKPEGFTNETYAQESRSLRRHNRPKYQKRMRHDRRERKYMHECDSDTSNSTMEQFAFEKISRLSVTNKVMYFVGDDTVSDLVRS